MHNIVYLDGHDLSRAAFLRKNLPRVGSTVWTQNARNYEIDVFVIIVEPKFNSMFSLNYPFYSIYNTRNIVTVFVVWRLVREDPPEGYSTHMWFPGPLGGPLGEVRAKIPH